MAGRPQARRTAPSRTGARLRPRTTGAAPLLLATLLPAAAVFADEPPPAPAPVPALRPYVATYAFQTHGFSVGTTTMTLQREAAGLWTYRTESHPRGLASLLPHAERTVTSRIEVGEDGSVRPQWVTDQERGAEGPRSRVDFDWERLRATGSVEGQAIDMALRPGVQEDQSAQVSLMLALLRGQPPAQFSLFDKGGIRDYGYERVGSETLHTALGDLATEVYASHKQWSPRTTRYWCAPGLGYLPVRVQQTKDQGVEWTMELRALQRGD